MHERWTHEGEPFRLDRLLLARLNASWSEVKRAIEFGLVRVDQHVARRRTEMVLPGSTIELLGPVFSSEQQVRPDLERSIPVLYENADWMAVDKPADTPVHPLRPDETGTVLNALITNYPQLQGIGEAGLRSAVVHRLDVLTSGVLLFAKTEKGWSQLRKAFTSRDLLKQYAVIVEGSLEGEDRWVMDLRIVRHKPAFVVAVPSVGSMVPHKDLRRCDLRYKTLCRSDQVSLVQIDLGTGFLHQIRAMMAANGHPVLGDTHYGSTIPAPRPMLHAKRIEFDGHIIEAPIPDDFANAMNTHNLTASP